jgi:carbon storage regulator
MSRAASKPNAAPAIAIASVNAAMTPAFTRAPCLPMIPRPGLYTMRRESTAAPALSRLSKGSRTRQSRGGRRLSRGVGGMLYLTRKVGESVIINDTIEVTVVAVRGKSTKLGFTFPPEASVLRREIHDRIRAEVSGSAAAPVAQSAGEDGA